MIQFQNSKLYLIFLLLISQTTVNSVLSAVSSKALPYNQPRFSSCARWNPNAITFGNITFVGTQLLAFFINTDNAIYLTTRYLNRTIIWFEGTSNPTMIISNRLTNVISIWVKTDGTIYTGYGSNNQPIDIWMLNASASVGLLNISNRCINLFIDINDTLYCANDLGHRIMKISLSDNSTNATIAAGTGSSGSTPSLLSKPNAVFVDLNFNLYVSDSANNRIQLFQVGQMNASTVAGTGAPGTIALNFPTGIILDGNNRLFITDQNNHRIIRSGPAGFVCLVGCSNTSGSVSNELRAPRSLWFDSHGNMFVLDTGNARLQKLLLSTNSCDDTTTSELQTLSATKTGTSISTKVHQTIIAVTTDYGTTTPSYQNFFNPPTCSNTTSIGFHCNISSVPCHTIKPCQNNGTCTKTNTTAFGYLCTCLPDFNGTHCQFNNRPCKPNTCWNSGICRATSNTTFLCLCQHGWQGVNCESRINYCENITCFNKGVCRSLLLNYSCECLGTSFSGRHCEITTRKVVVYQIVSRSLGYIAILVLISTAIFIITLDALKYRFGIDPVGDEFKKEQQKKQARKRRRPVIQRFVYVNAPIVPSLITDTPV